MFILCPRAAGPSALGAGGGDITVTLLGHYCDITGLLSAPLPLLAQEDPQNEVILL